MVFRAGEPSANPSGRPRALREIQELARSKSTIAINALSEIAEHGQSESARVAASAALLDRAWGKPGQTMDIAVQVMRKQLLEMTPEELQAFQRAYLSATDGFADSAYGQAQSAQVAPLAIEDNSEENCP